ncbi:hypothetical protein LTR33_011247 [Friedmanniomyces endolithicus]|nr:hypothetical protein LTR33_011247 [Friedmanniomyces endolithicus]
MALKPTRRVYSAEELHRLRDTTSQPRLREAIEEHDGDDAELVKGMSAPTSSDYNLPRLSIDTSALAALYCFSARSRPTHLLSNSASRRVYRPVDAFPSRVLTATDPEHVLRGSKSFPARSWRSRKSASTSLHVPSNKENRSTNASDNDRPTAPPATKTVPVLGEIAANNQIIRPPGGLKLRPSPTHSLRRKKIESLVQAHGSPDHVRVTAGGRIVPSEQSPLCHPRYGYSAIKSNGGLVKFAPNHPLGKAQWTQATQNGFVAQDINGRLCQIVDGTIMPLHETHEGLRLYIPAPNLSITQGPSSVGGRPPTGPARFSNLVPGPDRVLSDPPISSQINALEIEYVKLGHELKDVDKTEVLHGRTMGKGARDALISKRRELIVNLDKIRRALKSLREHASPVAPTSPRAMMFNASPPRNRLPPFLQQRQHNQQMMPAAPPVYSPFFDATQAAPYAGPYGFGSTPSPDSGFSMQPWALPPVAMFTPPSTFDGSISMISLPHPPASLTSAVEMPVPAQATHSTPADSVPTESRPPQNDGSRSFADMSKVPFTNHTHALSIKMPEQKIAAKSTLNPMSPVYKPGAGLLQDGHDKPTSTSGKDRVPTPLSPLHQLKASASSLKRGNMDGTTDSPTIMKHNLHSSSVSSFQTADFFPHNTRDFSTRKYANSPQSVVSAKENMSPATPAKDMIITHAHPTPIAPPATPVEGVPDRSAHNLSPKNKWLSPSIEDQDNAIVTKSVEPQQPADAAGKSREWLAGYYAALAAQQIQAQTQTQIQTQTQKQSPPVSRSAASRLPSPCRSVVSSLGSRPGRIFSGLFAQIEAAQQSSLNASLCTDNAAASAPSPHDTHCGTGESRNGGGGDDSKQSNRASPARAKFERIAETVGIKVDNLSPTKRRWRDVWRGSRN